MVSTAVEMECLDDANLSLLAKRRRDLCTYLDSGDFYEFALYVQNGDTAPQQQPPEDQQGIKRAAEKDNYPFAPDYWTKWFQCDRCKYKTDLKPLILFHVNFSHNSDPKPRRSNNPCKICTKKFPTKDKLKKHVNIVHQKVRMSCNSCSDVFSTLHQYKKHLGNRKDCSEQQKQTHKCPFCDKVYSHKTNLGAHDRNHNAGADAAGPAESVVENRISEEASPNPVEAVGFKSFQCQTCQKLLASMVSMGMHIKSFHQKGSFACKVCQSVLNTRWECKEHNRQMHGKEKNRPKTGSQIRATFGPTRKCEDCGETFAAPRFLRRHLLGKRCRKLAKLLFVCQACPKAFSSEFRLSKHVMFGHRFSLGENASAVLRESVVVVVGEAAENSKTESSSCDVCGEKWANASALRRHAKFVHGLLKCNECNHLAADREMRDEHFKKAHWRQEEIDRAE